MNIKAVIVSFLVLSAAMVFAGERYVATEFPDVVNSNSVTVTLIPYGEVPEWVAVMVTAENPIEKSQINYQTALEKWKNEVRTNSHTTMPMPLPPTTEADFDKAQWLPFKTSLIVDLGPGDGKRVLWTSFRYKGQSKSYSSSGGGVEVRTTSPSIAIYNPPEGITSQPVVQLKGYTSRQALNIKYNRVNEAGQIVSGGEGLVNDQYFDKAKFDFTTNYFTCYDVALDPGTNTFIVSADDYGGNHFSSKYVLVFSTVGDTNPPVFKIDWPTDGMSISGSAFDIHGPCDDPTAKVTVLACNDEGKTTQDDASANYIPIYVTQVPLAAGKNYITVVATDAAGNSSLTNLTITQSSITLTIDPLPAVNIATPSMKVTGFCSNTNLTVMVNDTKALMNPDGHWVASGVRVRDFLNVTTDSDGDITPPTNSWLPMICSQPTENNSVSAGLLFQPVSTNEYNHYRMDLGFTNTSGHSIPNLTWMLPKEDARFSLHLFDATNKEIAKHEWQGKTGLPLATNLNIHHLGKNEVEQIGGILPFPTNATARIAALNLDQHFQLPPPGDYRLEVTERLYKIAADGQLLPFEFPPITTTIKIIDQPSELVFYLNDLQRQGKLVWGAERDGLRIGVVHRMKWNRISDANLIEIFLQNNGTNDSRNWNLRLPNPNEQFDVSLYDISGKEIQKTALGKQQGQPLSLDGQNFRKGNRPIFLTAKDATDCCRFNLNDYFEIKLPGKYRLTYQQRFYRWNTNSTLTGITMPMVIVPLDINYIPSR